MASPGPGNTEHQSRSEYMDTYGKVYNSDDDEAAHEAWYNANAAYSAEHNAKGLTIHANGGIEGAWQHASAKLSLSEQRLVECFRMQNYPSPSSRSSIAFACQHQNNTLRAAACHSYFIGGSAGSNGGDNGLAFDFEKSDNVATGASNPNQGVDGTRRTSFTTASPAGGVIRNKSIGQSIASKQAQPGQLYQTTAESLVMDQRFTNHKAISHRTNPGESTQTMDVLCQQEQLLNRAESHQHHRPQELPLTKTAASQLFLTHTARSPRGRSGMQLRLQLMLLGREPGLSLKEPLMNQSHQSFLGQRRTQKLCNFVDVFQTGGKSFGRRQPEPRLILLRLNGLSPQEYQLT